MSSSPNKGAFAGVQEPDVNSKIPLPSRIGEVSNIRPDSVKQAIQTPPSVSSITQGEGFVNAAGDAKVEGGGQKASANELIVKLRKSIPDMATDVPVKALSGAEFPKSELGIVKQVGEFFQSFGNQVTRKGFGNVVLDEGGIKSDIAHGLGRAKSITFAALPEVIQYGRQIDFKANWKGRGKDSYVFAAPVTIGDKRAYVTAVVLKGNDHYFYLHKVLDGNGTVIYLKKENPVPIKTGLPAQGGVTSEPITL